MTVIKTNNLLDAIPLEGDVVIELTNLFVRVCTNPNASGDDLREAAKISSRLSAHYSICIYGLLNNADEADMNARRPSLK